MPHQPISAENARQSSAKAEKICHFGRPTCTPTPVCHPVRQSSRGPPSEKRSPETFFSYICSITQDNMKKVVLYIAMSLDGYIADCRRSVDWIKGQDDSAEMPDTYSAFFDTIDTVIMGKRTYDQITTELSPDTWPYAGAVTYVLTHRAPAADAEGYKIYEYRPMPADKDPQGGGGKGYLDLRRSRCRESVDERGSDRHVPYLDNTGHTRGRRKIVRRNRRHDPVETGFHTKLQRNNRGCLQAWILTVTVSPSGSMPLRLPIPLGSQG